MCIRDRVSTQSTGYAHRSDAGQGLRDPDRLMGCRPSHDRNESDGSEESTQRSPHHHDRFGRSGSIPGATDEDEDAVITESWTIPGLRKVAALSGHVDKITCIACAADGSLLATGSRDSTVRVWRTDNWKQHSVIAVHEDAVHCVGFNPVDPRYLLTGSGDTTVRCEPRCVMQTCGQGASPGGEQDHHEADLEGSWPIQRGSLFSVLTSRRPDLLLRRARCQALEGGVHRWILDRRQDPAQTARAHGMCHRGSVQP
eukprot:TRINITY_DN3117_c0_g1_i3.p1 TRINITY_DN3117_c0_g1~~TRINITY_DN3117_c0_g1_i3.p1  ORF type:complete len:256 (+),score=17.95 TRINITY_DN3117_c0_g1_i3:144-911(+)